MSLLKNSLYRPRFEHDSCGFGLTAQMDGKPSHWLVQTTLTALQRLTHRGAVAADGKTGDGCGLLLKMPERFMRSVADELDINLTPLFGVGAVFLSHDKKARATAQSALEKMLSEQGLTVAGWREVPIDSSVCGESSLKVLPYIAQIFVNTQHTDKDEFERRLFVARKKTECSLSDDEVFYIASLSCKVLSYKGLVMPNYLPMFYLDLNDERMETSISIFHQRFSTNTWPQWRLAQPFRFLAHNGEINTICGNRNWALARAQLFDSKLLPELKTLSPFVCQDESDSCSLDGMLEVLVMGGIDVFRAMRMLIPPAWQNVSHFDPDLRAAYEYNIFHMEPWDGPAGIVLTDGRYAACSMDRNGLRPARYVMTKDRHITIASEIGVYDYAPSDVVAKGRLKPGQMIGVDTENGELLLPETIDERIKTRHPYRRWLDQKVIHVPDPDDSKLVDEPLPDETLAVYEKVFDISFEEKDQVLKVLANAGQEAIGSMGDDTPLPVLSQQPRSLFDSFRQQFAQVTNPPIDPLREAIVMSLETSFGKEMNPFEELPENATRLVVDSPVLSEGKFKTILATPDMKSQVFDLNYPTQDKLVAAIESLCERVSQAVRDGVAIVVLSDRNIQRSHLPIHSLLACGAVHQRLIQDGLRCHASMIVETGFARDPHHFATLIGYGATAVFPYLVYQSLAGMSRCGDINSDRDERDYAISYRLGINKGLYKIISKMGISSITSYRGAQLFEAVGLHDEVVELCFASTVSRLQGIRFDDLQKEQAQHVWRAWNPKQSLRQGGLLKYTHDGEYHAFNPDIIQAIHRAVRSGEYADYQVFADLVNHRQPMVLRDRLQLKSAQPVPIDEVESAEKIVKRFDSAGMSLGALSPEAHETLAQAMNSLGGRSNSGEGGEDIARYGTDKVSKIKQVASGRFGVTPHYLVNAEVLQIKIAQGAKPGEGGQLPGHKVNATIARLRHSSPGIALISPPPHHDIYSIEDLAQLIFDLKQVNPKALVSVKLVAEAGVGTIAAGVAKAYADLITISGYDGGTGASPLTSIKYTGSPWELGLSETQQTLRINGLRHKVRIQTDGGLKTGLDVIKAALLGAESFGFGTVPMVAMGCKYLRICHLNNCATGVATQNKVLRMNHFVGQHEMVKNYFMFVAQEVRCWMAQIGIRRFEDLIGHSELLQVKEGESPHQKALDLSPILSDAGVADDAARFCTDLRNQPYDKAELAEQMVGDMQSAITHKSGGEFHYDIKNIHRSIGARISGIIASQHGNYGMDDAPIKVYFNGTAGQSFGVWNAGGLHLDLTGDANDYVGKGMASGAITIRHPQDFKSSEVSPTIAGNTCLYGATGGRFFAAGAAGERFAVRNSGAVAVVEGIGDHGCEYMTGGSVVVLGNTGVNFGAGMTGGIAIVLDEDQTFIDACNHELIEHLRMDTEKMERERRYLKSLLTEHFEKTGSPRCQQILEDFSKHLPQFWFVKPKAAELEALMASLLQAA